MGCTLKYKDGTQSNSQTKARSHLSSLRLRHAILLPWWGTAFGFGATARLGFSQASIFQDGIKDNSMAPLGDRVELVTHSQARKMTSTLDNQFVMMRLGTYYRVAWDGVLNCSYLLYLDNR